MESELATIKANEAKDILGAMDTFRMLYPNAAAAGHSWVRRTCVRLHLAVRGYRLGHDDDHERVAAHFDTEMYEWRKSDKTATKTKQYPAIIGTAETTKEETMTTTIENKTFINGTDASKLSDEEIFNMIAKLERDIKEYGVIYHKPKKLEGRIRALSEDIKALVEYVDTRA